MMAADETNDETPDTSAEETEIATPEGAVEEAAVEEAAADEPEAAPAGPDPSLSPVQKRAWHRQRAGSGDAAPRSIEDRQQERAAARRAKAAARTRRRGQEAEKRKAAGPKAGTPAVEHEPGRRQVRQGIVTSAKGEKTLTVRVDLAKRHPKYKKIVRSSVSLHVHDEDGTAGEGDTVRVASCRPRSRTKRWELTDVLERAK